MHFYMFFMIVKKVPHFLLIISEAINIYIYICVYIYTHTRVYSVELHCFVWFSF